MMHSSILVITKVKEWRCMDRSLTSGSGVCSGERGEILEHVIHHTHLGLIFAQRDTNCGSWKVKMCVLKSKPFPETLQDRHELSLHLKSKFSCIPAGLTCLNEVAAGNPRAFFNSLTSCQAFRASHRLMKPGDPFSTETKSECRRILIFCFVVEHWSGRSICDAIYRWVEALDGACRAEQVLDGGSCRTAGAAGKFLDCIHVWSNQKWPRRTERCVWRPDILQI